MEESNQEKTEGILRITSLWLQHSRHIQTLFVSVFCFFAIGFVGGFFLHIITLTDSKCMVSCGIR